MPNDFRTYEFNPEEEKRKRQREAFIAEFNRQKALHPPGEDWEFDLNPLKVNRDIFNTPQFAKHEAELKRKFYTTDKEYQDAVQNWKRGQPVPAYFDEANQKRFIDKANKGVLEPPTMEEIADEKRTPTTRVFNEVAGGLGRGLSSAAKIAAGGADLASNVFSGKLLEKQLTRGIKPKELQQWEEGRDRPFSVLADELTAPVEKFSDELSSKGMRDGLLKSLVSSAAQFAGEFPIYMVPAGKFIMPLIEASRQYQKEGKVLGGAFKGSVVQGLFEAANFLPGGTVASRLLRKSTASALNVLSGAVEKGIAGGSVDAALNSVYDIQDIVPSAIMGFVMMKTKQHGIPVEQHTFSGIQAKIENKIFAISHGKISDLQVRTARAMAEGTLNLAENKDCRTYLSLAMAHGISERSGELFKENLASGKMSALRSGKFKQTPREEYKMPPEDIIAAQEATGGFKHTPEDMEKIRLFQQYSEKPKGMEIVPLRGGKLQERRLIMPNEIDRAVENKGLDDVVAGLARDKVTEGLDLTKRPAPVAALPRPKFDFADIEKGIENQGLDPDVANLARDKAVREVVKSGGFTLGDELPPIKSLEKPYTKDILPPIEEPVLQPTHTEESVAKIIEEIGNAKREQRPFSEDALNELKIVSHKNDLLDKYQELYDRNVDDKEIGAYYRKVISKIKKATPEQLKDVEVEQFDTPGVDREVEVQEIRNKINDYKEMSDLKPGDPRGKIWNNALIALADSNPRAQEAAVEKYRGLLKTPLEGFSEFSDAPVKPIKKGVEPVEPQKELTREELGTKIQEAFARKEGIAIPAEDIPITHERFVEQLIEQKTGEKFDNTTMSAMDTPEGKSFREFKGTAELQEYQQKIDNYILKTTQELAPKFRSIEQASKYLMNKGVYEDFTGREFRSKDTPEITEARAEAKTDKDLIEMNAGYNVFKGIDKGLTTVADAISKAMEGTDYADAWGEIKGLSGSGGEEFVKSQFRQMWAQQAVEKNRLWRDTEGTAKAFASLPEEATMRILNDYELHKPINAVDAKLFTDAANKVIETSKGKFHKKHTVATTDINEFFKITKKMFDSRYEMMKKLNIDIAYWQDYWPHLFKAPEKVIANLSAQMGIYGDKGFLKHRKYPTMKEAIDAYAVKGVKLELKYTNPVDMLSAQIQNMDKLIMAKDVINNLKNTDPKLIVFVPANKTPPLGYKIIEGRFGEVRHFQEVLGIGGKKQKALVTNGNWAATEGAHKVISNAIGVGLGGSAAYRLLRKPANFMNNIQLNLSLFHLGFTSLDVVMSKVALGLQELTTPGFRMQGLKDVAKVGPYALIENIVRGLKGQKGIHSGDAQIIGDIIKGGFHERMDRAYTNNATKKFAEHWNQYKRGVIDAINKGDSGDAAIKIAKGVPKTVWKSVFAAVELAAKPVMEYVVPIQKLGVFLDQARFINAKAAKEGWDSTRLAAELQGAQKSTDNRMGQVVYENRFWNKTAKDVMFLTIRSVGWNLGTMSEVGGGVKHGLKYVAGGGKGAMPRDTAYVLALGVVTAIFGSTYQAVSTLVNTGKMQLPESILDCVFPRTGRILPDGNEERVAAPSYAKDVYAVGGAMKEILESGSFKELLTLASHKANPGVSALSQLLENKDYWGYDIYTKGNESADKEIVGRVSHNIGFLLKQLVPFSVSGMAKRLEAGDSPLQAAQSFVGIIPASKTIVSSPIENMISKGYNLRMGVRSKDENQKIPDKYKREYTNAMRRGDKAEANAILKEAIREGKLSPRQGVLLRKGYGIPATVRMFRQLPKGLQLQIYRKMNPEEKKLYHPKISQETIARQAAIDENNNSWFGGIGGGLWD